MILKVLIVEDDPNMRLILNKALARITGVEIVGEGSTGSEAVKLAERLEPDVIFMDVELPEKDGVEASREILDILPDVFLIYATGHPEYMPEAFEVYAFDYLLKPYKMDRLNQTISKIQRLMNIRQRIIDKNRGHSLQGSGSIQNKVAVRIERKLALIDISRITYISREKRKTIIHTEDGKKVIAGESLDALEKRVAGGKFIRTHRSYLVNLDKVTEIEPWSRNSYMVVFSGLKEVAYMTEERFKELQEKLNLG